MQDQQRRASDANIDVQKIDSTLTQAQRRDAEEVVTAGIPKLLYVTPERLEQREFLNELKQGGVSVFVVVGAHVISQWGHDFRPAYMACDTLARSLATHPCWP
jgi:ATP-dependent DNA helicase RecQ